ncbi:hypothetical protein F4703DRAFT_1790311 [Phycomyces blakesleeanus]
MTSTVNKMSLFNIKNEDNPLKKNFDHLDHLLGISLCIVTRNVMLKEETMDKWIVWKRLEYRFVSGSTGGLLFRTQDERGCTVSRCISPIINNILLIYCMNRFYDMHLHYFLMVFKVFGYLIDAVLET